MVNSSVRIGEADPDAEPDADPSDTGGRAVFPAVTFLNEHGIIAPSDR